MIEISKDEVREQLRDWGVKRLDELEETIGRELTEDEFREMIIFLIGYADYSSPETLLDFASFLSLEHHLSEEELEALKQSGK